MGNSALRVLIPEGVIRGDEEGRTTVFIDLLALGSPVVGARVRAYRKLAGLSQAELAAKAEIHPIEVSRLERRPDKAQLKTFVAVCRALERGLNDLLEDLPEPVE